MIIFEASVPGFVRIILIIFIIYYGFKLLSRYVFPWLLKRWVNKKMEQFQNQTQQQFRAQQQAKEFTKQHEGEIKIKARGSKSKPDTDDIGDFVDYEEVD